VEIAQHRHLEPRLRERQVDDFHGNGVDRRVIDAGLEPEDPAGKAARDREGAAGGGVRIRAPGPPADLGPCRVEEPDVERAGAEHVRPEPDGLADAVRRASTIPATAGAEAHRHLGPDLPKRRRTT
jgi:hypothetical protein